MKVVTNFFRKNWPIVIITFVTLLVWYKLLGQSFFGEAYYYFDNHQTFFNSKIDTSEYDIFPRIIFDILKPILKDNLTLYLAFQLLVMVILNLTFYLTLYSIVKQKLLAFTSAIFFAVSYIGLFEMLGTGNYQRFVQRVPNLIIILISFYFLVRYLNNRKIIDLIRSYLLFFLAVFLAHFSSFLLPLFVIYPAVWAFYEKKRLKNFRRIAILVIPYAITNYALISQDSLRPHWSMIDFLGHNKNIISDIILQFSSLNIPPFIIDKISIIAHPYRNTLMLVIVPIIIIYIFGLYKVVKSYPKLKTIYTVSLLMIPVLLFLGLYLGKVNPEFDINGFHYYYLPDHLIGINSTFTSIKGDRYYLVPMFFVSIIWASLIFIVFKSRKKIYKVFIFVFLTIYILYNMSLIWDHFNELLPLVYETNSYLTYIRSIKSQFKPNTALIVPDYFIWPSNMIRVFYGYPNMQFLSSRHDWKIQLNPENKNNVMIIDYDYKTNSFYNLTSQYNTGKKLMLKSY